MKSTFIKDIFYIIEGYSKLLFYMLTGKTRKLYKRRYNICQLCEHNKSGICDLCGCIIKAKVKVDYLVDNEGITIDGCPEHKW